MKNTLLILAFTVALAACGGGGGGSDPAPEPEPQPILGCTDETATNYNADATQDDGSCTYPEPVTVSGKAFDGYIVGGTAYLDINGNGQLDEGEPNSITKSGGDYTIEMTEEQAQCLPWSSIYVDVPVGALDEQEGEVTEAYVMAFPPSLDPDLEQEGINVSPLTTVVWDTVATALRNANKDISCEALSTDANLAEFIRGNINDGILKVVRHYNIPREKIYSDFIADGDTELQAKAVEIVSGLQASLKETVELQEQYPDSDVRVSYIKGSDLDSNFGYPEKWYREIRIWKGKNYYEKRVDRMFSNDLENVEKAILWEEANITTNENYGINDYAVWESRFEGEPYTCTLSEEIFWNSTQLENSELRVQNIKNDSGVTSFSVCKANTQSQPVTTQNIFVEQDNEPSYVTQFSYRDVLFDNTMTSEFVSVEVLPNWESAILSTPYVFTDRGLYGADSVLRYKNEIIDDGTIFRIYTFFNEYENDPSRWNRLVIYSDDTTANECSEDGKTWTEC